MSSLTRKPPTTKKRLALLQYLRDGGYLEAHIGGWYDTRTKGSGVRIRVETQDWLEATGELVEVISKGRCMITYRICHRDHTDEHGAKSAQKCKPKSGRNGI